MPWGTGSGPSPLKVLGHHSAQHKVWGSQSPRASTGTVSMFTANAQHVPTCGSCLSGSHRGCTACSPPASAISTSTLQISLVSSTHHADPALQPSYQRELLPCQTHTCRGQDESGPTAAAILRGQLLFSAISVQDSSHWHFKWEMIVLILTCQQGATPSAFGSILVSNTVRACHVQQFPDDEESNAAESRGKKLRATISYLIAAST